MWLLVLNRSSGKGRANLRCQEFISLCNKDGVKYLIIDESNADKTEKSIEYQLKRGEIDAVIAFGGDGLVSLCLQQVCATSIKFSVIPCGTGNDFARSIGTHNKRVVDIYKSMKADNEIALDAALAKAGANHRWYVQVLSSGFDASVNKVANNIKWPRGRIKYTLAMLSILTRFKSIDYEIKFAAEKLSTPAMLVAVANGSTYGGGMRILPDASYTDAKLDLIWVEPVSKITLLSIFPRVFFGTHVKHPAVHVITAVQFSINAKTAAYADGEYVGNLPIDISVIPGALNSWICK
jgi:diacylglycerol kinase (ATP)